MNWKFGFGSLIGLLVCGGLVAFVLMKPPGNRIGRPGGNAAMMRPETQIESNLEIVDSRESIAIPSIARPVSTGLSSGSFDSKNHEPWSRFRGADGKGVSDDHLIPSEWSDSKNLRWKLRLPGPGSSSPVLTDKFVFITTYSGYGWGDRSQGKTEALERQIHCIDRNDGKLVWTKSVKAVLPEDPYQGMGIPEHGYATNSPTSDGQNVYVFFGKSGVLAYDMSGNELWSTSVGKESGNRGWGTASSVILYKDLVIVNASEESQSIVALDKNTGKTIWTAPASILELAYGTPVIVKVSDERDDLVVAVPGEVWGLNPSTGKLVWYVETTLTGNLSPSVIQDQDILYVFGGYRSSGSLAIRIGGKGDSTKTHSVWTSRNSSYVVTPVLFNEHLYWIDDQGMYYAVKARTGELVKKSRVPGIESRGRPVYASPIVVDGKLFMQTRSSGLFVLAGEPEFRLLSQNRFASDESVFNATPAVSRGQLFLRSYENLYCIESKSQE